MSNINHGWFSNIRNVYSQNPAMVDDYSALNNILIYYEEIHNHFKDPEYKDSLDCIADFKTAMEIIADWKTYILYCEMAIES